MAGYTPQDMRNLLLKFYPGSYTPQSMGNVTLSFNPIGVYSATANIQASITATAAPETYQTTTYTYLKYCERYIIGYTAHGVQILTRRCVYGGIRDLGASIAVAEMIHDQKDLGGEIQAFAIKDLPSFLNVWGSDVADLPASLHVVSIRNLPASVYGFLPADLQAILNVIEIRDLPAVLTGELFKGEKDLGGTVSKIFQTAYANLSASISSPFIQVNLQGIINVIFDRDLGASILPLTPINLPAYILGVGHVQLYAFIHGFATKDLGGYLIGGFGPGDLQANIFAITPQNISAYIRGWKGIETPVDLRAYLVGSYTSDLQAQINIIEAMNLSAYLNAVGGAVDLNAIIIPKVILIRKAISIALLEHKNLMALINYRCQLSKAVDLSAYVYPLMKKDLKAYIIGWYGNTSDNLIDLRAYINTAVYNVQDRLSLVGFVPQRSQDKYTLLRVRFGVISKYNVFDDIDILYSTRYNVNLGAYLNGVLTSVNLSASLTPVWDWNYRELPSWIIPKTHEVVINLEKLEEQWQRFVEIMFDHNADVDYHYFYVSGESKVYRVERDKHWTIWVKSYIPDDESIIDRKNVRFKYGFNMSDYNTIDEAVRDLIDRVSAYRKIDLMASINVMALSKYKDLQASVVPEVRYTWAINLRASITGIP